MALDYGQDRYKGKTGGQKTLIAHEREEEKRRQEEEDEEVEERLHGEKYGLPWPPEENEEIWEADRQKWMDKIYKQLGNVMKPMPEKPALKKPPPLNREAAQEKARKIVDDEDAFLEYEKKHKNDDDDLPF